MSHPDQKIKTVAMLNAYFIFYVIPANQIGVGAMGFQSVVFQEAKQDSWISVLMAGVASMIAVWFMIRTLRRFESKDLYEIQEYVYGKWLGKLFNFIYMVYLYLTGFTILRGYIEVVQAWLFPSLRASILATLLLGLIIYGIISGIRVIVGYAFLSFIFTLWLFLLYYYPLQYANWGHLFPILENKLPQLLSGATHMSFTIIGFEIVYFVFPFLREKDQVMKYSQYGLIFTTLFYLSLMVAATVYYSGPQLLRTIWPTLNMYKIVELPFLERFEFIAVAYWMFLITPNCLLYFWASTRGIRKIFHIKQQTALYAISLLVIIMTVLLKTRDQINDFTNWVGKFGLVMSFVYPVGLYILVVGKQAWQRRRSHDSQT